MNERPTTWETLGATILVAGTCIGGGMLALPVGSGISGFWPSVLSMLLCCIAMIFTGLLLIEATLAVEGEHHMMTIADRLLGSWGRYCVWIVFLFMTYGSLIAYTAAGGPMMATIIQTLTGIGLTDLYADLILAVVFGGICVLGSRFVGVFNAILFALMVVTYFLLVGLGLSEVDGAKLARSNWKSAWMPFPILLTGFSVQAFLVPSMTNYLKRDAAALRFMMVGGLGLALMVFVLWQLVVLGVVPLEGPHGLDAALEAGEDAAKYLQYALQNPWIASIAAAFGFLALVTSFLGLGLGLVDFLVDSFSIPRKGGGLVLLALLVIVPTIFCATYFERVFIQAFDLTGGFGDSILNGILPVLMVWRLRYVLKEKLSYQVGGGRLLLILAFAFYAAVFCLEFAWQVGWISTDYLPDVISNPAKQ